MMKIGEIYTEAPKVASKCKLCGNTEIYYHEGHGGKRKGKKKYPTPFYFKAFYVSSWFRGDDDYLGRICKTCIKQGRLEEIDLNSKTRYREIKEAAKRAAGL